MGIAIEPYGEEHIPAVRAFNARLSAAGVDGEMRFPEHPLTEWLPHLPGRRIYQEPFVALDDGAVRGGFILKHQEFSFRGEARAIAHYRLPLSEGIVDRRYAGLGIRMLRSALQKQPLLFALGMGGFEQPLPRMLKAMGWRMTAVPFHFRVTRPFRFLRGMRALRGTALRRMLLDAAAFSGAGWAGLQVSQWRAGGRGASGAVEICDRFGPWADALWEKSNYGYGLAAVRDRAALELLYPAASPRFVRLQVRRGPMTAGWAVVLDTRMRGHKQFGDLRVGTIADCLAAPENAALVVRAAARELEARGVDLIISNQAHGAWTKALRAAGFLSGPSNFLFAASPRLAELLEPFDLSEIHMNRGDGDGPVHL